MDEFTIMRLTRFLSSFKHEHGRDASESDLETAGFSPAQIDGAVRKGALDRYQVTTGSGSRQNRFKIHRDWRSLRDPTKP
jgi:hypothetical protein